MALSLYYLSTRCTRALKQACQPDVKSCGLIVIKVLPDTPFTVQALRKEAQQASHLWPPFLSQEQPAHSLVYGTHIAPRIRDTTKGLKPQAHPHVGPLHLAGPLEFW